MGVYWQYVGTCQLPSDLPDGLLEEWKSTLKAEQARILANLQKKIPDEPSFKDRIADASSDAYESFLASTGPRWNRDLIVAKQRLKLARKYSDWKSAIQACFGSNGYFPATVDAKADKFKLARYVLGAVGFRPDPTGYFGVWNPVVMGVLLLAGDTRCERYFDANDSFTGTLHSVVKMPEGNLVRPSIIAQGVQAAVLAKFADEGGLASLRDALISNANSAIANFISIALDDVHKGAGYSVTYVLSWDPTAGNVKVTVTDTHP